MSETAFYPVLESTRNKSLWLSVIYVVCEITLQTSTWHVVQNFIHLSFVRELINIMPNMDQLKIGTGWLKTQPSYFSTSSSACIMSSKLNKSATTFIWYPMLEGSIFTLEPIIRLENRINSFLLYKNETLYVILPWGNSLLFWVSCLFLSAPLEQIIFMLLLLYIGFQTISPILFPQDLWTYSLYSRAHLLNNFNIVT